MLEKPDRELLRAHVERGDEAAFEELVRRHLRLVKQVCRRILGPERAARETEDVIQAVFMALHLKAEKILARGWRRRLTERLKGGRERGKRGKGEKIDTGALTGWLYNAACKAALRTGRDETRYRERLRRVAASGAIVPKRGDVIRGANGKVVGEKEAQAVVRDDTTRKQVLAHLDEALLSLPAAQREALVLHYFEGKTRAEMAALMGCPEGTAARRVNAGLDKLRKSFRQKNLTAPAALLVSCLEAEKTAALTAAAATTETGAYATSLPATGDASADRAGEYLFGGKSGGKAGNDGKAGNGVNGKVGGNAGSGGNCPAASGNGVSASTDEAQKITKQVLQGNVSPHAASLAREVVGEMMNAAKISPLATALATAAMFVASCFTSFAALETARPARPAGPVGATSTADATGTAGGGMRLAATTPAAERMVLTSPLLGTPVKAAGAVSRGVNGNGGVKETSGTVFEEAKPPKDAKPAPVKQGSLRAINKHGAVLECPLKHTSVYARVDGFIASVEVKQTFRNPTNERIEAVYIFPLPENSAVDRMVMQVGKRQIVGEIHLREEARMIYEAAKEQGKKAALLEQERPNVFTQNVANIGPGEEVVVTLRYNQKLKYDKGVYRFTYPMTIGPRYCGPLTPAKPVKTSAAAAAPKIKKSGATPDASKKGVFSVMVLDKSHFVFVPVPKQGIGFAVFAAAPGGGKGKRLAVLTTKANGLTDDIALKPGQYLVRVTQTAGLDFGPADKADMHLNIFPGSTVAWTFCAAAAAPKSKKSGTAPVASKKGVFRAKVLDKLHYEPVQGIGFAVFAAPPGGGKGKRLAVLTTKANGLTDDIALKPGQYLLRVTPTAGLEIEPAETTLNIFPGITLEEVLTAAAAPKLKKSGAAGTGALRTRSYNYNSWNKVEEVEEKIVYGTGALRTRAPHSKTAAPTGESTATPDASRISPPFITAKTRNGHDISLTVELNAGVSLSRVECRSHVVGVTGDGTYRLIKLNSADSIPNKDFLLEYEVAGKKPEVGLTHYWTETLGGGYFLTMIQPKKAPAPAELAPKEMIFIVDTSGSMGGWYGGKRQWKMETAKAAMRKCIQNLNPRDTFQFYSFSDNTKALFPKSVPATPENMRKALKYIDTLRAAGGTRIIGPVNAALSVPESPSHLRMVCFMTDGDVGDEGKFLSALKNKLGNARVFMFGVGAAPNRYCIERAATIGRGKALYIRPTDPTDAAVNRFFECVRDPYLTQIKLEWEGVEVFDVVPHYLPDLYAGQPLLIMGRYKKPAAGKLTLRGKLAGKAYSQTVAVDFTDSSFGGNPALPSVWARERIKELERSNLQGRNPQAVGKVIDLALTYGLMSQYTSFVAVDEEPDPRFDGTLPKTVRVPLYLPEWAAPENAGCVTLQALPFTEYTERPVKLEGGKPGEVAAVGKADGARDRGFIKKMGKGALRQGKNKSTGSSGLPGRIGLPGSKQSKAALPRGPLPAIAAPALAYKKRAYKIKSAEKLIRQPLLRRRGAYYGGVRRHIMRSGGGALGKARAKAPLNAPAAKNASRGFVGVLKDEKNKRERLDGEARKMTLSDRLSAGVEEESARLTTTVLTRDGGRLEKEIRAALKPTNKKTGAPDAVKVGKLLDSLLAEEKDEGRVLVGLELLTGLTTRPELKKTLATEKLAAVRTLVVGGRTPLVRRRALTTLWALRGADGFKFYKLALKDEDAGVRLLAYRLSLAARAEKAAKPAAKKETGAPKTKDAGKNSERKEEYKADAETLKLLKKALEDDAPSIRLFALRQVWRFDGETAFKFLKETLRQEKLPALRVAAAKLAARGALRGKRALPRDRVVKELDRALRRDHDQRVFLTAMKGLNTLDALALSADRLAEKIYAGDPEKEQYLLLSAAGALSEIAAARAGEQARERGEKKLTATEKKRELALRAAVKWLVKAAARPDRGVKLARALDHTVDSALKIAALNVLRTESPEQAFAACAICLRPGNDLLLRRAAAAVATEAGAKGVKLVAPLLKEKTFRNNPKLLTRIILAARGTKTEEEIGAWASGLLREAWLAPHGRTRADYALLRAALVEALTAKAVRGGGATPEESALLRRLLRKDPSWRVRRAVLCAVARLKDRTAAAAVRNAMNDPHPVVREQAAATAVALTTRDKKARDKYLRRLARAPETVAYREIFNAEKLDFDVLVSDQAALRKLVVARLASLPGTKMN